MAEAVPAATNQVDYLIVGAGISGLYCGHQLVEHRILPANVRILEKSNRVGGLLKSTVVKIDDFEIKQEEGGMRFYKHHRVYKLAEELELKDEIIVFKMGGDNNLNYFRGRRFTQSKSDVPIWYDVFNTGIKKTDRKPIDLLSDIFKEIINENKGEMPNTPEEWQHARLNWTVKDPSAVNPDEPIPLYKWDFEYLLRQKGLYPEAIRMIQYSIGFRSLFNRNVNAGFGFQSNLEFSPQMDSEFYTLKRGYDTIAHELHQQLTGKGMAFEFESEVVKYCKDQHDFPFKVQYEVTHETTEGKKDKTLKEIRCKNLIFAIPKLAILKLSKSNEIMNVPNFDYYINSVISQSMVKINLYFRNQWWSELGITDGPNYTDLKLGTVYPFNPIPKSRRIQGDKLSNYPGSLTIYCDYESSIYWRSYQTMGEPYAPVSKTCSVEFPDGLEDSVPASEMVVKVALNQLKLLFQRPDTHKLSGQDKTEIIPDPPVAATFTHWIDETFGDSIHAWKVGIDDSVVSPKMYKLLGENIAIIGESYSIAQEWVEGALNHTSGFIDKLFPKK